MKRNQYRKLQSLIRKHTEAQVKLSWSGSADPEDREIIESNAAEAKKRLYSYMSMLVTEVKLSK